MSKVLVIGSIHLDIIAKFRSETSANIDKIGQLRYSVGGAAYNIAANLAYHDVEVGLLSVIKSDSLSNHIIMRNLKNSGIDSRFVERTCDIPESGFVAHVEGSRLVSAVSCVGIEHISLDGVALRQAIRWADVVAIESNLTVSAIQTIARLSSTNSKPLLGCVVSESKVDRLFKQFQEPHFEVVVMNTKEALRAGHNVESRSAETPQQICKDFASRFVIVTRGPNGWDLFSADELDEGGHQKHFGDSASPDIVSDLGAGDALFAAVVSHAPTLNWEECDNTIKRYLAPVLMNEGATPRSTPVSVDFRNMTPGWQILAASVLFLPALMTAGFVYFSPTMSLMMTGILALLIALLSGAAGGALSDILRQTRLVSQPTVQMGREVLLGSVSGALVAILFALPYIMQLGKDAQNQLRSLMLYEFVYSLVGGFAFQPYLERLIAKTNLPLLPDSPSE